MREDRERELVDPLARCLYSMCAHENIGECFVAEQERVAAALTAEREARLTAERQLGEALAENERNLAADVACAEAAEARIAALEAALSDEHSHGTLDVRETCVVCALLASREAAAEGPRASAASPASAHESSDAEGSGAAPRRR